MKSINDGPTCYNGVKIPCIGVGTYKLANDDATSKLIAEAIGAGFRHIDTAFKYGNEQAVGKAIAQCGVDRSELFITTKLWNDSHGYEQAKAAFKQSMDNLGLDYLDLYLIHWPNPLVSRDCWQQKLSQTWKAFEELYQDGKIRAIGVSNFMPHHFESLMQTAEVIPMVNQFNLSPGRTLTETVEYCKSNGIVIEATKPLARGKLFEADIMKELSHKYKKTPAQLCIRWSLQNDFIPLPKSSSLIRIKENADVFDFEIKADDMAAMSDLTGYAADYEDPDKVMF
ncbi:MAG: aldo/keto reductase [Oscillospiraceae bacterium]